MKNTKNNKALTRAAGVALSAIMIMSVSAATLGTVTANAMPTEAVTGIKPGEEATIMDVNTGKDVQKESLNHVSIKNAKTDIPTFLVLKDESKTATVQLYDGNMNPVGFAQASSNEDGIVEVMIPNDSEGTDWYYADIMQLPSEGATDYSFAHLDVEQARIAKRTLITQGETKTLNTQNNEIFMDGENVTAGVAVKEFTFVCDKTDNYKFNFTPEKSGRFHARVEDSETGEFVFDCEIEIENGETDGFGGMLEGGKTYTVIVTGVVEADTSFGFEIMALNVDCEK